MDPDQIIIDPEEIVPPAAVALIDQFLHDLDGSTLISAGRTRDMLLDVRLVLWKPTPNSEAIGPLLDSLPNRRVTSPLAPAR